MAFQNLLVGLGEKRLLTAHNKNAFAEMKKVTNKSTIIDDFEECYPESIKKIESKFSQLTCSDVRYAVMFALGLSDGVIADIKNVNSDSIRKTKLRMRKKLGLENGCDLKIFFSDAINQHFCI